jgi:hypothetical protein
MGLHPMELKPGDFSSIPPGHDSCVLGNDLFVCVDFSPDMKQYAKEGDNIHSR